MQIAINATEAFWRVKTGTGYYVRNLISHLPVRSPEDEVVLLGIQASDIDTSCRGGHTLRLLRSPRTRTVWSKIRLPIHFMTHRYDVVHIPEHKLPTFVGSPTVVTIHDLACLIHPESFSRLHRERLTWFTRDAVQRADHIIAISSSTKKDICSLLPVRPEKIHVVHHGVDHEVFRPGQQPGREPMRYILSVGELQPRKNYLLLIRAFKKMCERLHERVELKIVGKPGWEWEPITREATEPPFQDRVKILGYVPESQLVELYQGATMVAMPSLYEGFGLPLPEAMACGVPVIASNTSSFPEIVGEAGILLDPTNEADWVDALELLFRDDTKRQELSQRSLEQAKLFDWQRVAEETSSVYRKVCGS